MANSANVYSIAANTPNNAVSVDRLTQEYELSSIVTALDHIDTAGDVLTVWTKDVLSVADKATLDAIIAAHSGLPLPDNQRTSVAVTPFSKIGANFSVVGKRFVAALNAITPMDISFAEDREVQSAKLFVENSTDGDFMDFFMMGPFGPGGSLVPVVQWGETIFVKEKTMSEYKSELAKTIPAGITLRLVYHSTAVAGTQPVAKVDLITWK